MDAPLGSVGTDALSAIAAGDNPGVSLVLVDGKVVVTTSRNTPPATRKPTSQGHRLTPMALMGSRG